MKIAVLDELRDILHAEKQLTKALPKMAQAARFGRLRECFEEHLTETEGQIERLNECFDLLGETARAKPCKGMMGLVEEGQEIMAEGEEKEDAAADLALIGAAQRVEHYEISTYTTAKNLAPVTPALARSVTVLNKLFNELAYDPPGAGDSYLFWSGWGAHATTSMFTSQDAHGPLRRGIVFINCPSYSVLRGIVAGNPRLGMLTRLLRPVAETEACPQNFVPPGQSPIGAAP